MNPICVNVKKKRLWALSERITNKVNFTDELYKYTHTEYHLTKAQSLT